MGPTHQIETADEILGMAVAHCLEAGILDYIAVAASLVVEINARLQFILKIYQKGCKEQEVRSL